MANWQSVSEEILRGERIFSIHVAAWPVASHHLQPKLLDRTCKKVPPFAKLVNIASAKRILKKIS